MCEISDQVKMIFLIRLSFFPFLLCDSHQQESYAISTQTLWVDAMIGESLALQVGLSRA